MNEQFKKYAFLPSDILLPKNIDMKKWAVVACDQYTSDKNYWDSVAAYVNEEESTLHLIYPEVFLETEENSTRINKINETMNEYIKNNIFTKYENCFVLVERTTTSGTRYGLMASLDLEHYDYSKDSKSLIRATEGTILSRIPPRKEIRKNSPLELPHIMVLLNDEKRSIIEPLVKVKKERECIYNVELMKDGGTLKGYLINSEEDFKSILSGIESIYSKLNPENPILFAMGDGNHSLATAKSCYEDIKKGLSAEEKETCKARYALVELENIFDPALLFEAIHRVFFTSDKDKILSEAKKHMKFLTKTDLPSIDELNKAIDNGGDNCFGLIDKSSYEFYTVENITASTAAGTFQHLIDTNEDITVDYIHGTDVVEKLAKEGNIGIILPNISKETFFHTIEQDSSFPRKTFSIGHAEEKRFYMEAREIK